MPPPAENGSAGSVLAALLVTQESLNVAVALRMKTPPPTSYASGGGKTELSKPPKLVALPFTRRRPASVRDARILISGDPPKARGEWKGLQRHPDKERNEHGALPRDSGKERREENMLPRAPDREPGEQPALPNASDKDRSHTKRCGVF